MFMQLHYPDSDLVMPRPPESTWEPEPESFASALTEALPKDASALNHQYSISPALSFEDVSFSSDIASLSFNMELGPCPQSLQENPYPSPPLNSHRLEFPKHQVPLPEPSSCGDFNPSFLPYFSELEALAMTEMPLNSELFSMPPTSSLYEPKLGCMGDGLNFGWPIDQAEREGDLSRSVAGERGIESQDEREERTRVKATEFFQTVSIRSDGHNTKTAGGGRIHTRRRRIAQESFRCEFPGCGKVFTRPYNLKSHQRTHTSDRPFICPFPGCEKAFARQHDRNRHAKLHLGIKPYVCPTCMKAFARQDALSRHQKVENSPCTLAALAAGL
ncbi:uncharacterized protein VTP21DRAFT_7352 [Calcarisporiella thermophila]|uniref:uncharacterized protein n=1 Tax=Calcarisporiella thermophila TaxID=911321 RepID=UPI0037422584